MPVLFAYGTLQDPAVQERLFGRVVESAPDELLDFAIEPVSLPGGVFSIAIRQPGSHVNGSVLFLSDEELRRADAYEPAPYVRICAELESGLAAWLYARGE